MKLSEKMFVSVKLSTKENVWAAFISPNVFIYTLELPHMYMDTCAGLFVPLKSLYTLVTFVF